MYTITKLIAALSLMDHFDVVWQESLFGHRDINNTACPGLTFYNSLAQIANSSNTMTDSMTNILNARNKTNEMFTKDYLIRDGLVELIITKANLNSNMLPKMLTLSRGISEVQETEDLVKYFVDPGLANQLVTETILAVPEAKIGPNFTFQGSNVAN